MLSVIEKSIYTTQTEIAEKIECSERKVRRIMKTMMIERIGERKMGKWIEK